MSFDSLERQAEENDDISWSDVEKEIFRLARSLNKKLEEQIVRADRRPNAEENTHRVQVALETANEECKLSIEILIGTRQIPISEPYGYRTRNVEDSAQLDDLETDRLLSEMSSAYRDVLARKVEEELATGVYQAMETAEIEHFIEPAQKSIGKLVAYIRNISDSPHA